MSHTFTFNDISSQYLKLVVQKLPPRPIPQQRRDTYVIPGRHGTLHTTDGTYDSIILSIECVVTDVSLVPEICKVLQGSGKLSHSGMSSGYFYKATVLNASEITRMCSKWSAFQVQFECQPFIYSPTYTFIHDSTGTALEAHLGTISAQPQIKVFGTGNLSFTLVREDSPGLNTSLTYTVNSVSSYVLIDSETLTVHKDATNKLADFSSTDGNFPVLSIYGNSFSGLQGNTTKLEVTPNWRFL